MKKIFTYPLIVLTILTGLFSVSSCKDFLDVKPRNKKVVRTVEDQRDILASYIYFMKNYNRSQINIMGVGSYAYPSFNVGKILSLYTGESALMPSITYYNNATGQYTPAGFNKLAWLERNEDIWDRYYSFLGPINMLIKSIDEMECDDPHLRDYVKGEAMAWRAFAYFKLLQYYSPYDNAELGVPIYLDPSDDVGNAMPGRRTQKEVFSFILKDCNDVLALLKQTPTNEWNLIYREDFIRAMMASVYTWKAGSASADKSDWQNAETNADLAIGSRKLVADLEQYKRIFDCNKETIKVEFDSPEFYIRIRDNSGLLFNSDAYRYNESGNSITSGVANLNFVKMYSDNDKRKSFFFYQDAQKTWYNDKYNLANMEKDFDAPGCYMPFRLAEMYLIKAEAECRMGNAAKAAEIINYFRSARYESPEQIAGDANSVLKVVLDEREKEFLLENDFLWLDMKRLGKSLTREINGQNEVLAPNDFRYTFPVPAREMKENKNIKQAPEWAKYN